MACRLNTACFRQILIKTPWTSAWFYNFNRKVHVVMANDESVIVCWHPEKFFPYEKSQPVEKKLIRESNAVLKVQSSKELLSVLRPKKEEIIRQELVAMTHTLKHLWFPPKFQFRRKKNAARDRPYL